MRALRFEAFGEPRQALRLEDVPDPVPGPGEVRLSMVLRPINPSDLLQVKGVYGRRPILPATAGLEGLGVVEALGPDVEGLRPGQRVVPLGAQGTWADQLVTPAGNLVAIPDGLSDEMACQVIVNPLTAWLMAVEELGLGPGDWLVQTASGSAVGRCLLQIAKLRGFKVLSLVRRRTDLALALEAEGVGPVLSTEDPDWGDRALDLLPPEGATAAVDAVGGIVGGRVAMLLRRGGTLLVYGALSMEPLQVPGGQMIFRTLTLRGFWLTDWKQRTPNVDRDRILAPLLAEMAVGRIGPPVEAVIPLDRHLEAIALAESAGRAGKVLLSR
jgi:NADPH:quinone reductase-like Zn-dependent oxidoreductase